VARRVVDVEMQELAGLDVRMVLISFIICTVLGR